MKLFTSMMLNSVTIATGLFVFVLLANFVNCHCRDKYIYHTYYKVGCGLDQVPTKIPADVTILYISYNNISQITVGAFSSLTNCNELWLANNKLTHISVGMFSGLTSLRKLALQNNSIVNINEEAFTHLPELTELWLHGNSLTQIRRDMFMGLKSLEKLTLNNNYISSIDDGSFKHLVQCTKLWLHYNKLPCITEGLFKRLRALKILLLSHNEIGKINSGSFCHLTVCTDLWIDNNNLSKITENMLNGLQSLELLYLHCNDISYIQLRSFTNLYQLKELHLHQNKLTTLAKDTLPIPHHTRLALLFWDNPLQCDNKMCWVKEGEEDGWITLTSDVHSKPDCKGIHWDDVTITCTVTDNDVSKRRTNQQSSSSRYPNKEEDLNTASPGSLLEQSVATENSEKEYLYTSSFDYQTVSTADSNIFRLSSKSPFNNHHHVLSKYWENQGTYIVGGLIAVGGLVVLMMCLVFIVFIGLISKRSSVRRRLEQDRSYMHLLHQRRPSISFSPHHPVSPDSSSTTNGNDVHIRHYYGEDSNGSGYEVPVDYSIGSGYELPGNNSTYEVPVNYSAGSEYEVPIGHWMHGRIYEEINDPEETYEHVQEP